ncbi:MAG TPA: hypothetical protein VFX68_05490 [Sulfuricurvum sp.]|nr:hypothetical protein [Sulfuricurvum sp.]
MRLFYYVHTGHRIGLDRFRRAAAILNELNDLDITLLCSDYRIAGEARKYGIKKALGLDLIRNIPQIAHHGDKIIVDSAELNPTLHEDMSRFFSTFIRIGDDPHETRLEKEFLISPYLEGEKTCKGIVVDPKYQEVLSKTIPMALFFGDDDYEKDLERHQALFAPYKMELLMGYYHFLGYENALKESFTTIHESEEYDEVIRHTDVLISASPMAILQNFLGGGRPIYLQRPDYTRDFIPLFESMGIPIVDGYNQEQLRDVLDHPLSNSYQNRQRSNQSIIEFIRKALVS